VHVCDRDSSYLHAAAAPRALSATESAIRRTSTTDSHGEPAARLWDDAQRQEGAQLQNSRWRDAMDGSAEGGDCRIQEVQESSLEGGLDVVC
jgi:hypothetical protein